MQLEPIGTLFSNSWQRYQKHFTVIVPIFLFPMVIIGIGQLLGNKHTLPTAALGGVLNFVGAIISVAASLAMITALGKNKDFGASYQAGFKLFWASVWISILAALASFGGFVLLVIPGIMLAVQLAFVQYALVLENKNGIAALAQSREYVKGYWWAFVGRALLLGLVYLGILLVIYLPFHLLLGGFVAALIYGVLILLFTPFSICYSYEIFENLRRLKPNASEAAAKTEKGFLKVCMVVGVVGIIGAIIAAFAAIAFLRPAILRWSAAHPNGYNYTYPTATSSPVGPYGCPCGDTPINNLCLPQSVCE